MGLVACSGGPALPLTLPDGHAVTAAVITRDEDRRAGLVGRPPLAAHEALLLRSPRTATLCITTAPMAYPIDVLFLDAKGRIRSVACARDASHEDVCADEVRDVLELRPPGRLRLVDRATGRRPAMTWLYLWLLAACGEPAQPTTWATPAPTWQVPLCRPPERLPPLQATVRVRLLLGDDVAEEALAVQTRALVDWWAAQGLTITLDLPVQRIPARAMLEGTADLSDDLGDAARSQELARVLAPVRAFIPAHARPVREHTIVVAVLPRIAAPGSWADASFEALRGLTLSPRLPGEPAASPVQDALRLDGPYTPVVLLSQADLDAARSETARLTLAHEVGHALGLAHHPDAWNLMAASPAPCIPLLDAAQVHQLRQGLQPVVPLTTQPAELR